MAALTIADFTPALKVISEKLSVIQYEKNPAYALMPKTTNFGGRFVSTPLRYSNAPDGSADDTVAFSATISGQAKYTEFQLTPGTDYVRGLLRGVTIAVSEGDKNAVISAMKASQQAMQNTAARSIGNMTAGSGTGVRGKVNAVAPTTTFVLSDPQQVVNFEVNQRIQFLSANSFSATVRHSAGGVDYVTITKVDRATGTITIDTNVSGWTGGGSSTPGAGDFVIRQGDIVYSTYTVSGGNLPVGVSGWVPFSAPSATAFFTVDRTTDLTRLGGLRYTGNGAPPEETLIRSASLIEREGGMADTCIVNTADFADLQLSRESKVVITADAGGKSKVSFTAITVSTGYGKDIKVVPDVNWPKGYFHILQMDTWKFRSAGKYMALVNLDGNSILRQAGADAYELRMAGYGQFSCDAPGWNLAGTW